MNSVNRSFNHFWQRWLARGCEHGRNNTEIKQIRLFNAISIPSIAFLCATGALHLKNTAVEAAAVLFTAALALVFSLLLVHWGKFHVARRMYIAIGISIIVLNQIIYGKTVYVYLTIFSIIGIQLLLFEYSTFTSKYGPPLILALSLCVHKWSGLFITPIHYPNGANFYVGVIVNVLIIFLCFRSLLRENSLAEAQLVTERDHLKEANAALNLKEKNLVDARIRAEEANQFKGIFLAKISHELRTPMNGVLGMAQLLQDTDLSGDQRDFANLIVSSGHQQLSIINTLLDFAKIDVGKMLIEKHNFSFRDLLNGLAKSFAAQCSIKGLTFAYEIALEVCFFARVDKGQPDSI
jgi:signal transduction histidine kinase